MGAAQGGKSLTSPSFGLFTKGTLNMETAMQLLSDSELDEVTGGVHNVNVVAIFTGKIVTISGASKGGTDNGGNVTIIGEGGNTYNNIFL
jgi:hypothetical protein